MNVSVYWGSAMFRKGLVISLLLLSSVLFAAPVFSPSQVANIKKRGYIRVGIFSHNMEPFVYHDKNGKLIGIDVDLAREIARFLEVKVVFDSSAKKYGDLIDRAYNKQDDIVMSGIIRTPIRAQSVSFSAPYYKFNVGILVSRLKHDQFNNDSVELLNNTSVTAGVIYGSAYIGYLQRLYPKAKMKMYTTDDQLFKAVSIGEVDFCMMDEVVIDTWLADKPARALRARYYPLPGYYAGYAILTSYDYPMLTQWLSVFVDEAKDTGFTGRLLKKYTRGTPDAQ